MADICHLQAFAGEAITVPADLGETATGWALSFTLAATPGGAAVHSETTAGGGIVIATDTATITLTATDTGTTIGAGTYHYTLRRTDGGSEVVLTAGMLTLLDAPG